jgi:hypothetical protein
MKINPGFNPNSKDDFVEFGEASGSSLEELMESLDDEARDDINHMALSLSNSLFKREDEITKMTNKLPPELLESSNGEIDSATKSKVALIEVLAFQQWQLSNLSRTIAILLNSQK